MTSFIVIKNPFTFCVYFASYQQFHQSQFEVQKLDML